MAYYAVIESVTKYEHVDTNNILYPFGSGCGRERCGIKAIFLHLNILNYKEFQQYTFFSEDEIYYTSSCMESFLDICKNFEQGVDLVKYIECITGKSIYQLYKEFKR